MQDKLAQVALRTSLLYGLIAGLYILLSDRLLVSIVSDPAAIGRLATYKGVVFVIVTALLLYTALRTQLHRWEKEAVGRIAAEEALRQNEARYRLLAENTGDVIWLYDVKANRFTYVSPSVYRLRGFTPEEIVGKTMEEVLAPASVPFVRVRLPECIAALEAGDESARLQTREVDQPHKDGSMVSTEVVTTLLQDGEGRVTQILGVSRDITERKRAEQAIHEKSERLDLALNAAKAGFWEWDLRTNENIWSDELWPLYGLTPHLCKPSYELWLQSIHPDDRPLAGSTVRDASLRGDELNVEWRVNHPGGPERWLMSRGRPEHDQHGRVIRYLGIVIDITERKRAEEALLETKERYRSLFGNMLDGYAYCRMFYEAGRPLDFVYLEVNPAFESLTGLKDVIGKRVSEVIPGIREENPGLFEIYGRVARTGKPEKFETCLGSLHTWFSIAVYSPEKECFVTIFENITERKWAEHALRESETRYRALFESSPLPKWLYNPSTLAILAVNNAAVEHYGYSHEEFLGMTIRDVRPPGEAKRTEAALESDPSQHSHAGVWRHRKKDGALIDVDMYTHEVVLGGQSLRIAVLYDITDLKRAGAALVESEEKYRRLVENAWEAIYVVQRGVVMFGNNRFAEMTGLNLSEVVGKSMYDLIPPEEHAHARDHHDRLLRGEVSPGPEAFRVLAQEGAERWVSVNAVQISWLGNPATLNFATDMTDRKRAEDVREATVGLLRLCNKAGGSRELMEDLIRYFQQLTG
jgi:PAS domain S-box-containing protein